MVGDHDKRAAAGPMIECSKVAIDGDAQSCKSLFPEHTGRRALREIFLVQAPEVRLTGNPFDRADHRAFQPRIIRAGVREILGTAERPLHDIRQPNRLSSQSIMARLVSAGFSCWVQWPESSINTFSRSGT